MAVDSTKPKLVLVVHGVEAGEDKDQNQDQDIKDLILSRLNGAPLPFDTTMCRYENINDEAQQALKTVLELFAQNMLEQKAIDLAVDIVGDVVIALADGSTAQIIRQGLVDRILEVYAEGNPLYLVAHSLGSVYAFDAINQLIRSDEHFKRDDRKTWPVQGLVTLGSPLGLKMFKRNRVKPLGEGRKFLRWINYWARTDPIVSGSFYGKPQAGYNIVERFATDDENCGWLIHDRVVDIGKTWLMAHVGYWHHPGLGDDLVSLLG